MPNPHANEEHWSDHAICRGADPDLFFPIGYAAPILREQEERAKAVCGHCPVVGACLSWALRVGEPDGIWGGTTPEERRLLRRAADAPVRHRLPAISVRGDVEEDARHAA
ncbi:WhiB family transcriptional regulator [Actinomadura parmotrematis]|uniref:Transcriptional regulator WhiB n=1 Tax=Actinomadura parmotrematis TaxID=2864039 RepID=A0ABS7FNS8_9ACTN|nr:WhiB family transcriptional regulator [Actinomadura parmotrematis]MBW8482039.1 WhiB family transcriptional regulator [Actinomadura parmotrematis]